MARVYLRIRWPRLNPSAPPAKNRDDLPETNERNAWLITMADFREAAGVRSSLKR